MWNEVEELPADRRKGWEYVLLLLWHEDSRVNIQEMVEMVKKV